MTHHPILRKLSEPPDIDTLISWRQSILQSWQEVLDSSDYDDARPHIVTWQFLAKLQKHKCKEHTVNYYGRQLNRVYDKMQV